MTPSPDPWEVLEHRILEGIDCECRGGGHEADCAEQEALAALTTLREQMEAKDAALRQAAQVRAACWKATTEGTATRCPGGPPGNQPMSRHRRLIVTNPVTPSPDPWEVLTEAHRDSVREAIMLHDRHVRDHDAYEAAERRFRDALITLREQMKHYKDNWALAYKQAESFRTRLEQAEALVAHADANCGCQAMSHALSPTGEPTKDDRCPHGIVLTRSCLACGRFTTPDSCPTCEATAAVRRLVGNGCTDPWHTKDERCPDCGKPLDEPGIVTICAARHTKDKTP